jgi:hypothetical protein
MLSRPGYLLGQSSKAVTANVESIVPNLQNHDATIGLAKMARQFIVRALGDDFYLKMNCKLIEQIRHDANSSP